MVKKNGLLLLNSYSVSWKTRSWNTDVLTSQLPNKSSFCISKNLNYIIISTGIKLEGI